MDDGEAKKSPSFPPKKAITIISLSLEGRKIKVSVIHWGDGRGIFSF
jgi:hypothetical protein